MADTYAVTPEDVASELRGLFPSGFDVDTVPTEAQVIEWISTADDIVRLQLVDETGQVPALTDAAARLVKTYIREWVKNQVVRTVYAGQDPLAVQAAAKPYADMASTVLAAIQEMGTQAVGTGAESPRVSVAYTLPDRDLVVTDDELDMDNSYRTRKY